MVEEKIIEKIRTEGPLSFNAFMEMALYYPSLGYYTSPRAKIGGNGDFYTSPYLGNVFGTMIARQIEEMWQIMGETSFAIVECGAGTGLLCHDILHYLASNAALYEALTYYIIEKSSLMREREKTVLAGFTHKVKWIDSIAEVNGITGCILSNELVDNFAVHRVVMEDQLMEVFVDYNGTFVEQLRPASDELTDYLRRFNVVLPRGYKTEINLEAESWIKTIAHALKKGFVITIDYGLSAAELYSMRKRAGTLLCYHKHTINEDPFRNIGEQDITTHVNFSALAETGKQAGLACCGFTNQLNFLRSLGLVNYLRQQEQRAGDTGSARREQDAALYTLLFNMGQKMKVLVQKKGVDGAFLSGMQLPLQL